MKPCTYVAAIAFTPVSAMVPPVPQAKTSGLEKGLGNVPQPETAKEDTKYFHEPGYGLLVSYSQASLRLVY
jgi:hypothetical protein